MSPTDEVGKDAIAVAVMPGSQRGWTLVPHEQYYDDPAFSAGRSTQFFQRHRIPFDQIDFGKEELVPMQPGDVTSTYADVSKLAELTGYSPKVLLREGLQQFASWYRSFYPA